MTLKKTKQEKASEEMQVRLERFCKDQYPDYFNRDDYEEIELHFVAEMSPHEIWRADFEPIEQDEDREDEEKTESVYLVWNGREIMGYDDDAEGAFFDVLTEQKELRSRERMTFLSSPLIVSGILAVGLLALIGYMSIFTTREISQLWTVFTAVIAFYFGKEGWSAIQKRDISES